MSAVADYSDCAVVYTADKPVYVEEALQSLRSAREHLPGVVVYLQAPADLLASELAAPFDRKVPLTWSGSPYLYKHRFLDGVSEPRAAFLDGDTLVCAGLRDAFDLLHRFELAAAHAPYRGSAAVPAFNTGVIFARNTERVRGVLNRWPNHVVGGDFHDQPAFRRLIMEEDVAFYVLPPEFNARLIFPLAVCGTVRIAHARLPDPEAARALLNAVPWSPRVFVPSDFGLPDLV